MPPLRSHLMTALLPLTMSGAALAQQPPPAPPAATPAPAPPRFPPAPTPAAPTLTQPQTAAPAQQPPVNPAAPGAGPRIVQQPAARAPTQLPTWALQVGGMAIQFPYFRDHCLLDENQTVDRGFLDTFRAQAGTEATVLAATASCRQLQRVRAGTAGAALELMVYQSFPGEIDPTTVNKQDVARQICEVVMQSREHTSLVSVVPRQRTQELFNLGRVSDTALNAVLQTTARACYVGQVQRTAPGTVMAQAVATTIIKGRFVAVTAASINGIDLERLWTRAGTFITRLSLANGEG